MAFTDDDFKKIVRNILNEGRVSTKKSLNTIFEYGDEFGDFDAGDFSDFRKAFIDPFTDVAKTAMGSLSNISSKSRATIETFVKAIPSLIIPFVSTKYENIFAREEARMEQIRKKYGDVFNKTNDIFNKDASLISFMLNPYAMIASKVLSSAPASVLNIVDALSGQDAEVTSRTEKLRNSLGINTKQESLIRLVFEYTSQDTQAVKDLVLDLEDKIKDSSVSKNIKRETQKIINDTLLSFRNDAKKMDDAESFEDIQTIIGKKINVSELEKLPEEEKQTGTSVAAKIMKNAYYEALNKGLELAIEEFKNIDIPEGSDLVKVYKDVVSFINNLKK